MRKIVQPKRPPRRYILKPCGCHSCSWMSTKRTELNSPSNPRAKKTKKNNTKCDSSSSWSLQRTFRRISFGTVNPKHMHIFRRLSSIIWCVKRKSMSSICPCHVGSKWMRAGQHPTRSLLQNYTAAIMVMAKLLKPRHEIEWRYQLAAWLTEAREPAYTISGPLHHHEGTTGNQDPF